MNLGSYNYLGFAENSGACNDSVIDEVNIYSTSPSSSRLAYGNTECLLELEAKVAKFVGKEAAVCFGMGYATNSTSLPSIAGPGDLVLSDNLNHASIIVGLRSGGCTIRVFEHNDSENLERCLREAIVEGQPKTHVPWRKIIIIVEGIYSMEGEICRLPELVAIKKKYKAYLYVDEAHSIGALGAHGRGVCEYYDIDPSEIDILMGTFTKSFGSAGGYICGPKELIDYIKATSFAACYDTSMSPPLARQIITSMSIIDGTFSGCNDEGEKRISALRNNSNYFRRRMKELGFVIFGSEDSPIIPMMIYYPHKLAAFTRLCLEHNIGVVVVGYPATPLLLLRARFCISASHTIADLEEALQSMTKIGDLCLLRYNKYSANEDPILRKEREHQRYLADSLDVSPLTN